MLRLLTLTEQRCRTHRCQSIHKNVRVQRCTRTGMMCSCSAHLLAKSLCVLATRWILCRETGALCKGKQVSSRVFWTERGRWWEDELPLDKSQPTLLYFDSCQPPTLTFCLLSLLFCPVLVITTLSFHLLSLQCLLLQCQ